MHSLGVEAQSNLLKVTYLSTTIASLITHTHKCADITGERIFLTYSSIPFYKGKPAYTFNPSLLMRMQAHISNSFCFISSLII